jgi:hypothetical protein
MLSVSAVGEDATSFQIRKLLILFAGKEQAVCHAQEV